MLSLLHSSPLVLPHPGGSLRKVLALNLLSSVWLWEEPAFGAQVGQNEPLLSIASQTMTGYLQRLLCLQKYQQFVSHGIVAIQISGI